MYCIGTGIAFSFFVCVNTLASPRLQRNLVFFVTLALSCRQWMCSAPTRCIGTQCSLFPLIQAFGAVAQVVFCFFISGSVSVLCVHCQLELCLM